MRYLPFLAAALALGFAGAPMRAAAAARGAGPASLAGNYKVIVNANNPTSTLARADVSKLFLKKLPKWPATGVPVVPVDQPTGSPVREAFSRDVHGKPADAVASYWQQQIFSGRGVPPAQKGSDDEVVAFVKTTPGAIAYVSKAAAAAGVKVVAVGE